MPPITVEDFIAAFSDAAVETEGVALDKKKIALELHAVITDIEDALGKSDLPAKHPARKTVQKQVDRLKAINLDDPDDLSKVKNVVKKTKADSTKIKALLKNDHFIRRDKKAHDYLERFKEMTSQLNARGLLRDGTNEDLAKFRPAEGAYGAWKRKLDSLESGEVSKLNEGFFNSEIGKLKDEIRAVIQKGQTAIEESQKNAKKQLEDRAKLIRPLADAIEVLQNNFACLLAAWNVVAKTDDTFPLRDNRRSFIDKLNEMRSAAEFPSPEAVAEEVRRCEDEVRDMQTEVETMGRLATTELEVTAMTMPDPHRRGDEWRAPLDELRRHFDDLINDTKAKRELESERSYKELKEILSSSAVPALSDFLKCAKNIDILERKLKEKKKVTFGN
ncbi:MAG: hypothetical protein LBS59_05220, partial [Puniceicoccales bacterium]|nr:hypothetical protein [Puniceicoccales bacterium]